MIIFPAIDILDAKGVRLKKGDYKQVTDYGSPLDLQKTWSSRGSKWLHIVDLNAARQIGHNRSVIGEMLTSDMHIQVGGGIRTLDDVIYYLNAGAKRVILGTILLKDKALVKKLLDNYAEKIVLGIDAKDGRVAVEGWSEISDIDAVDLLKSLEKMGAKRVIYTDISRDGMLIGPNLQAYKRLIDTTEMKVIASGGITSLEDLKKLKLLGVEGAIIGKSLYEGIIKLEEVLCWLKE